MSYFQAKLLKFYDTAVNVFLAVLQLSAVILSGERSSAPSVSPAHSSAAWWSSSLGSWHYIQPAFSIRIASRVSVLIRLSRLHLLHFTDENPVDPSYTKESGFPQAGHFGFPFSLSFPTSDLVIVLSNRTSPLVLFCKSKFRYASIDHGSNILIKNFACSHRYQDD